MDLTRPFAVVTPSVDGDVLAVLGGAAASFTGRQVQQLLGRRSEKGVRNALQRLCAQGVVTRQRAGSADLYALNRRHLAAPYIEGLAGLRGELLRRITAAVEAWATPPVFVALFGSAARGDMALDSDLDLFVVRPDRVATDDDQWRAQLGSLSEDVTAWTGNDARVFELASAEVGSGLAAGARALLDIETDGVPLYGPDNYLRAAR
jgi:Nucleotidyltransferase domain